VLHYVECGNETLSLQVISLELSTGIPMLYIFKEDKFIRRGSPVGPSEASVYAYTRVSHHFSLFQRKHSTRKLYVKTKSTVLSTCSESSYICDCT
jgi:hypothetical protein